MASVNNLQFSGLASGIDSTKIIDGLTSINQQRIVQLQTRKAAIVDQQTTFGGLQAKLLNLQGSLTGLSRSVAGSFEGRKTTVSDESIATAAASSSAQVGTFAVTVDSLAKAQQIASQGFADSSSNIRTGMISLRVGSGAVSTITIDSTNNTLQGLAGAINSSGGEVSASIVRDGSGTPFRLLLTAKKTGEANTITVTDDLTTGTAPALNLTQTVQAASDAQVRLGTGAGAIVVKSASNQVSDLISGVTLNLKSADPTKTLNLSVTNDTDTAKGAVKDLVDAFNGVIDFIDQRNNFDPKTQRAGVLLGNRDVTELQSQLQTVLTDTVPGVNPRANSLAAVGITFNDKGRLIVNESKLDNALNGKVEGVALDDVRRLFALTGRSDNAGVSFVLGSSKTRTAVSEPVQVDVTRAASRASITGTSALASSVTITSSNNSFLIRLNGLTSVMISLPPGTYSPAALAAAIQESINSNSRLAGNSVTVDLDASRLQIASDAFGAASKVSFEGGTALATLGFTGAEQSTGVDVAGSFKVGALTEAATGVGQTLSGQAGNANTDGLQLRVTLGAGNIAANPDANVTVTQGVASRLNDVLNRFLDPASGRIKSIDDRFTKSIEDIDNTVKRQNEVLDQKKQQLVLQFASVESAVSRLKSMGEQITAQLGGAAK